LFSIILHYPREVIMKRNHSISLLLAAGSLIYGFNAQAGWLTNTFQSYSKAMFNVRTMFNTVPPTYEDVCFESALQSVRGMCNTFIIHRELEKYDKRETEKTLLREKTANRLKALAADEPRLKYSLPTDQDMARGFFLARAGDDNCQLSVTKAAKNVNVISYTITTPGWFSWLAPSEVKTCISRVFLYDN
jgi:hypothetical protein